MNQPTTTEITTTERRCYCPGDCNCRNPYRYTYCGCQCANTDMIFDGKHWVQIKGTSR